MSFIYWEKQSKAFCGVHCINNLLQGALFAEKNFDRFAQDLDAKERELTGARGPSSNWNQRGNYSIQVLSKAIERAQLSIEAIGKLIADGKLKTSENYLQQEGYILNMNGHWFAIRKLKSKWYNLDSLSAQGPTLISDFYLSAYLDLLQREGWSIFVVQGKYPKTVMEQDPSTQISGRGHWFDLSKVKPLVAPSKTKTADSKNLLTPGVVKAQAMVGDCKDSSRGIELIKQAIAAEEKKDLELAITCYRTGIGYLLSALKTEKMADPKKEQIRQKVHEYLGRAEEIQRFLDNQPKSSEKTLTDPIVTTCV